MEMDASLERVWAVLTDVEAMPEWTSSMTRVQRLDGGPFAVGSPIRIKQPRLPAAVWQVIELAPGHAFTWRTTSGGVTTEAEHALAAGRDGGTAVTFTLRQRGLLAPLAGLFTSALTRRYVDMELQGLKARSEGFATP